MTTSMQEAWRAPGSEWLKDHPRFLEIAYDSSRRLFVRVYPVMKHISPALTERFMRWSEDLVKGWIFNCRMCGQCILHSTGMTCPMTCPKALRNGPCGGVRPDGNCEVIPEMRCVWVQAWERSQRMRAYAHDLHLVQPPLNHALQNTSAWINLVEGREVETPSGWGLARPHGAAGNAGRVE